MLGIALAAFLMAHGDASWIMNEPRYVDRDNVHCCGPTDCERAPKGALHWASNGVRVADSGQVFPYGAKGLYTSKDGEWWWCRRGGTVKCVFAPGAGA